MSLTEDFREREVRAAKNQSLFREINERVGELNKSFSLVSTISEWICECAMDTCIERIVMSVEDYEAIRQTGGRFFVAPSDEHVWSDVEEVTTRTDRYWIVEKFGHAGELAKQADPRANDPRPRRS